VWEVTKYEFGIVTDGITPIRNFMKICADIVIKCAQADITAEAKVWFGY
jgi:hypothetical protein